MPRLISLLSLFAASAVTCFAQNTYTTNTPPTAQGSLLSATLPPVKLDRLGNNLGIAQQTARNRGLQARILWMDAGANVGNLGTPQKIQAVIDKTKASGINMIVLDVKPIVGDTVYPSKYAPKLSEWKNQKGDPHLDVLHEVLIRAHSVGLPVYANLSTFGEGHKYVGRGLAYTRPEWQTILYEVDRSIAYRSTVIPISVENNLPSKLNTLADLTDGTYLGKDRPGYTVAVLNFNSRVVGLYDGATLGTQKPTIPLLGSALIGKGKAGDWLKQYAVPNRIMTYRAKPKFIPIVDAPEQVYTMFCDPINPEVRQHELDIVREIVTNYDVDGMVFDDRLRYAGLNADFGPRSRAAFEAYVGKKLTWPNDIFETSVYPGQPPTKGQYYQQWLNWRAGNITSWLDEATQIVRSIRPTAQVGVYVGSWYGDYEKVASNWAANDFEASFSWLTPEYQATGYAQLLDWITTGCYYRMATVAEAHDANANPGITVEGAAQLSNTVVNDAAWTYAGLAMMNYKGNSDQFARALQGAAAGSQGVMIFDLSQIIEYNWWSVMADAFAATSPEPPNKIQGLLAEVRAQHAKDKLTRKTSGAVRPYIGLEDTGF